MQYCDKLQILSDILPLVTKNHENGSQQHRKTYIILKDIAIDIHKIAFPHSGIPRILIFSKKSKLAVFYCLFCSDFQ